MVEKMLTELRQTKGLENVIIGSVVLVKEKGVVEINLITDKPYSDDEFAEANSIVRKYIPECFDLNLRITKLTPDESMVAKKIFEIINENNRQLAAIINFDDIKVERKNGGFYFTITVIRTSAYGSDMIKMIVSQLKKCFCGDFDGECKESASKLDDIVIEEKHTNAEYVIPVRHFNIVDFAPIEGTKIPEQAVYIADLNFVSDNVVVCGEITRISERTVHTKSGKERQMLSFVINDTTAAMRFSYFCRQKSIEKIRELNVGDSVVLTCKTDIFNGEIRATVQTIDFGKIPENFVPEKRKAKPTPKYYETVFPERYIDFTQNDFFTDTSLPSCLTENEFVVVDIETTGLNSVSSTGNMDRIIEIGAYKIIGGEIKESFATFINPQRKISEEITNLTGIDQSMVKYAPTFSQVMPDFVKFVDGCYLVGHNIAKFDFKFIDYYSFVCGYDLERKLFDTLSLSQELLRLSNYKLNTIADYFGIKFNHHRAVDDALATAKAFIELIKIKKSLPTPC